MLMLNILWTLTEGWLLSEMCELRLATCNLVNLGNTAKVGKVIEVGLRLLFSRHKRAGYVSQREQHGYQSSAPERGCLGIDIVIAQNLPLHKDFLLKDLGLLRADT